jgi:fatty-acyl-CoA synthase
MRTADPTTGEVFPWSEEAVLGEIQLRGCVTTGYLEDPEVNARSFTSDGWFRTGDLGWIDGQGRLHFAGRLKEVVKVNGITVSPAEVEALVMQHDAVDQAWAFGWPMGEAGEERLACAVVLRPGYAGDEEQVGANLRRWMRERVSAYKVPDRFVVVSVDDVPTTATGKVSKRLIGERFVSGAGTGGIG